MRALPVFWRVFAINAALLALATALLALSPATVSFPVALTEAVVLGVGLGAMLVLNFALLRRALAPLERLRTLMRGADPLRPGTRAPVDDAAPELRAVAETFNEMVERLEIERRESTSRALAAQEQERLRIARDLHDEVGQRLTGAMLQLERVVDGDRQEAHQAAASAREDVRGSLEEVRRIARRLRPEALDHLGLSSALAALTIDASRRSGIEMTREIESGLPALLPEAEVVFYRVAQEALTNVTRHSGAAHARLELRCHAGTVALSVTDDGAGFDPQSPGSGTGIRGMRERAVGIGADLQIAPAGATGTQVRLTLPARNEAA